MTWRAGAACRGLDPEMFYPERGGAAGGGLDKPMEVCASCPVRAQCLADALDREEFGIWGGMTAHDRRKLRRATVVALQRPENVICWDFLKGWRDPGDEPGEMEWRAS